MDNHYHLVARIPDARVSRALQRLHTGHSHRHSRAHHRSAHLFRSRPLAQLIDSDGYLLAACRYLAVNPVRAGMCARPQDWPWSSYSRTAGYLPADSLLEESPLLDALGPVHGARPAQQAVAEP
jgi:putative transposase